MPTGCLTRLTNTPRLLLTRSTQCACGPRACPRQFMAGSDLITMPMCENYCYPSPPSRKETRQTELKSRAQIRVTAVNQLTLSVSLRLHCICIYLCVGKSPRQFRGGGAHPSPRFRQPLSQTLYLKSHSAMHFSKSFLRHFSLHLRARSHVTPPLPVKWPSTYRSQVLAHGWLHCQPP